MTDLEKALASPATVFEKPEDVAAAVDLDDEQKRRVLDQWALDLRELMVATGENMGPASGAGNSADLLQRVERLLREM